MTGRRPVPLVAVGRAAGLHDGRSWARPGGYEVCLAAVNAATAGGLVVRTGRSSGCRYAPVEPEPER